MNKQLIRKSILCGAAVCLALTGCSGKGKTGTAKSAQTEEAVAEQSTESSSIRTLTLPDPSEYLITDAGKYVDLGDMENLSLVKSVYVADEEAVAAEIDNRLYEAADLVTLSRAAEEYDILTVDVTVKVDGEEQTETDHLVELGYEEFGSAFDEAMVGHKAGDHLTFSQTFDEDSFQMDWIGKTVDFDVTIKAVQNYDIPELTDKWVQENTSCDTADEYRKAVQKELEESYERESTMELRQMAVDAVADSSHVHDVPEELNVQALTSMEDSFAQTAEMFGMTLEEAYDAFGYTEETLHEEALSQLNRRIVLSAISQEKEISITEDDLYDTVQELYQEAGYESAQDLIDDYGILDLSMTALENKVGDYLVSQAAVSEEVYDDTIEDLEYDETYVAEETLDGMAEEGMSEIWEE